MIWDRRKELVPHRQPIRNTFPSHQSTFRAPRARPTPSHEQRDGGELGQPELDTAPWSITLRGVPSYTHSTWQSPHAKIGYLKSPILKGFPEL